MAISDLSQFRARLSYDQISTLTGWKDKIMINDYLGITASSSAIIDQVNLNEVNINLNKELIELSFQYLHGPADYSPEYDDNGTTYNVGDLVTEDDSEYAASINISAPAGVFNPADWNRVSTTDNYAYLKLHESETVAHGSTGDIVGNEDFCTDVTGGVVLIMALVADAVSSAAEVTLSDVGGAPGTYSQSYANAQTDLINDVKAKHNQMLADLNAAITQLNELIANSKLSAQMSSV